MGQVQMPSQYFHDGRRQAIVVMIFDLREVIDVHELLPPSPAQTHSAPVLPLELEQVDRVEQDGQLPGLFIEGLAACTLLHADGNEAVDIEQNVPTAKDEVRADLC